MLASGLPRLLRDQAQKSVVVLGVSSTDRPVSESVGVSGSG